MKTKRFVLRQSLIGKKVVIEFTNKKGETRKYHHDKVYEANKDYTNTNNLPTWAREFEVK